MRISVRLVICAATACLLGTNGAQATVTESHITSPSDVTYVLNHVQPASSNRLEYTGTSNGTTGDTLDVFCTYDSGGARKLYGDTATVKADGSFSGALHIGPNAPVGLQTCVLRAMPDHRLPVGRFTGPRIGFSQVDDEEETRPYNGSEGIFGPTPMDFFVAAAQLRGYAEWRSVSSCGLTYSYPYDDAFGFAGDGMVASQPLFNCAGALYVNGTTDARSQIRVDGVSVVTGYGARVYGRNRTPLAAYPKPSRTYDQDPATGDITIVETEPLAYCRRPDDSATVDPPGSLCLNLRPAGVRLVRTIRQQADGMQMTVIDSFVNEGDEDRTITAIYDQHIGRDATPETGEGPTQPIFSFEGGAYQPRATGTVVAPGPETPGIIGIQGNPELGTDLHNPQGSILYSTAPSEVTFTYANDTITNARTDPQPELDGTHAAAFEMHYERPLPASGTVEIEHVYTQATSRREADALTAAYRSRSSTPALAIESPANGATVTSPTVAISGTASDRFSAVRLTVNGATVPVVDGRWSTTVALTPGANVITAVAANAADRQTQAHLTVIYSPSVLSTPQAPSCIVPDLVGTPEALARLAITRGSCTVGKVRQRYSVKVRRGQIISSSPRAGTRRGAAHPVDLVVSRGAASSKFRIPRVKVARKPSGRVDVDVELPGAGRYEVLATYGPRGGRAKPRAAKQMKPGPDRRIYARRTGKVHRAKSIVARLNPTKQAKASLELHRKRGRVLTVRVHVRFAPVDGRPSRRLVKTLRLR